MTALPTTEITPTTENLPGTTLVGDCGNLSLVNGNVYPSSVMDGMLAVETEHGTLYLDPDLTVEILTDAADPLTAPLTAQQVAARADENGTLTAIVPVDLDYLLAGDLDALNDEVSEQITGSIIGLTEISYQPAGHRGSEVLLAVTGNAADFLAEHGI